MGIMSAQEFKINDINNQSDIVDRTAATSFGHETISPVVDNASFNDSVKFLSRTSLSLFFNVISCT